MNIRALFAAALMLLPAVSQAWWNEEWQYRKKLTLNTTDEVKSAPLLVRLHTGNFAYFSDVKPDGSDLRVVAADDKSELKFHIEKFDAANQMAMLWVQLPSVKAGDTLWLYYGNPKVAASAANVAGSYDAQQALVYHFDAQSEPVDATAYANQPQQFTAQPVPSLMGAGAKFNGDSIIQTKPSAILGLDPFKGWSFSSWVKLEGAQSRASVMQLGTLALHIDGAIPYVSFGAAKSAGATELVEGWHHLAVTAGAGRVALYVDGKESGGIAADLAPLNAPLTIGSGFKGEMDEVQVAATVRSVEWLRFAAAGQGSASTLLTLGDDEAQESAGGEESTSYFGVILQNVTLDGWVVIGILAIMAVISWLIMIGKGFLLSRVGRDNKTFLRDFRKLGLDNADALDAGVSDEERMLESMPFLMALAGKHDHYQSSPLYHIYHTGIQELHNRVGRSVGAQACSLSPQAVQRSMPRWCVRARSSMRRWCC
jgi:biopolymer transport protein ExbB